MAAVGSTPAAAVAAAGSAAAAAVLAGAIARGHNVAQVTADAALAASTAAYALARSLSLSPSTARRMAATAREAATIETAMESFMQSKMENIKQMLDDLQKQAAKGDLSQEELAEKISQAMAGLDAAPEGADSEGAGLGGFLVGWKKLLNDKVKLEDLKRQVEALRDDSQQRLGKVGDSLGKVTERIEKSLDETLGELDVMTPKSEADLERTVDEGAAKLADAKGKVTMLTPPRFCLRRMSHFPHVTRPFSPLFSPLFSPFVTRPFCRAAPRC